MSSRSLDDLQPDVRGFCILLMAKANAEGMPVTLIDTLRTPAEQQADIAKGVSWTENSLHLPQPPDGLARAFDLAPSVVLTIKNWGPDRPEWQQLGEWGEALGLQWGGRFPGHPDPSHFQLRLSAVRQAQVPVPSPKQQV
jgi:hypothetical protein